ncbi:MAG: bifunctional [glutamate--ammonia ligase]-adenylyl-L-tyrosine phosphorylase/[glutamate--ammonia-ligase] adenylyltransferase [Verrucomicrobiota bacterium]|nr:bifunctional [glutamate--ammonia ligase]-adenylyl-L-tyrosine phosphorylase/[glutamate--ammonia-ligase] adenylyltransferase [Limisphaera sp.]MDW8380993.1 bifunctional [glutamate--ammonia ligase]-adenylyl-L-tyrosine phosphorylase/[glutamate--ammonia-ligase] adenylyltransferase [Verrucomicrobiota bacterium]
MSALRQWREVLRQSADPERAQHHWQMLWEGPARTWLEQASTELMHVWSAVLAGSQVLPGWLIQHPEWLENLQWDHLRYPRHRQGLERDLRKCLAAARSVDNGLSVVVRRFKQREQLRIAMRDLGGLATVEEVVRELSDLADVCLSAVWDACCQELLVRHGTPWQQDTDGRWRPIRACVLGMGKLGGRELNYCSDVDLMFVYSDEGLVWSSPPRTRRPKPAAWTAHQFFQRLAEVFIGEVTRMTPEGDIYRVDMRLRPEGDSGPLARSIPSYENYYAQWGQTWERMMLMKARSVAGDPEVAAEFVETIQAFRHPRSVGPSVLEEIAALKARIEREVLRPDELDRNVKLGRGGIREIEFIVQALQLLHAGRQPFLQTPSTLAALEKLAQYELLPLDAARDLADAYRFLRKLEHRLQMEAHQQTHRLPTAAEDLLRLARLMGFSNPDAFHEALQRHTRRVRALYETILPVENVLICTPPPLPERFQGSEAQWTSLLGERGFRDPAGALRHCQEFVEGPGFGHVSARTIDLARRLLVRFLDWCPHAAQQAPEPLRPENGLLTERKVLSDPDRVLTRLISYTQAYGARATLFETWHANPGLFDLLLLLFDRSEFLAEAAIRTPDLVEDQVLSGRLRRRRTAQEILTDLRLGRDEPDQFAWLRTYHHAEQMRIGLRDILGLADPEQYLEELTALAEACVQYALEVVMRKHRLRRPPFAVIGLGKLGGGEIDYGSDLDVLLVATSHDHRLDHCQRWASEWMELLNLRTESGLVFIVDTRLRPDGPKGLLVNSLEAHEDYYRRRAQLWEIQALSRARAVAGDETVGRAFESLARALTNFQPGQVAAGFPWPQRSSCIGRKRSVVVATGLAAWNPDWRRQMHHMRLRIQQERTPPGQDDLAIKTGRGGLMDAEFVAQMFCLQEGWHEPNTVSALNRAVQAGRLPLGTVLLENYRRLRRVEGVLRRWSYEGESILPVDPAAYRRVSIRCGFASPEAFREALAQWRQAIRRVYLEVFEK